MKIRRPTRRPRPLAGKLRERLKARWQKLGRRVKSIVLLFTIGSFVLAAIRLWLEWRK